VKQTQAAESATHSMKVSHGKAGNVSAGSAPDTGTSHRNSSFDFKVFLLPAALLLLILLAVLLDYVWPGTLPFSFAIVPLLLGGYVVIKSALQAAIAKKKITAGMLVVLALIGTATVGEYLSGAVVAFMMIFGEFLEDLTMEKTKNAVRELIRLVPPTCRILVDGVFTEIPLKSLRRGHTLQVRPGEQIAADGIILRGQAAINEASITGESMPVDKKAGDPVFVGTHNENGVIEVRVDKLGNDTLLGKIIQTVKAAQENKGHAQKTADVFAQYFLPIILGICIITYLITWDILRVMTILVIACPCALVLATPTAVVASVGNRAKKGVLIKGGATIETCARVTALCLDKTGTLTTGEPCVVAQSLPDATDGEAFLYTLAIAEKNSGHPIAKAILRHLREDKGFDLTGVPDGMFEMLFGRGVRVTQDGTVYEVSNKEALIDVAHGAQALLPFIREQEAKGRTVLIALRNNRALGAVAVADTLRPVAREAIRQFQQIGIQRIIMLTGDNEFSAQAICEEAGIPEYRTNLLPEQKLDAIRALQAEGEVVAMVGDGVNDAPALVISDVGIAMGEAGTAVAVEVSDITLMSDHLTLLPPVFLLCRRTLAIIHQNIWVFAVCVNIAGIALSGLGILNPILAALIHNASSIFVVLNSSRLLSWKYAGESRR